MTTGSVLIGLALLLVVGLFVMRPFLLPAPRPPRLTERETLLAEKEALLAQIRALDFDAETGKQDEAAYTAERERLMQQATAVMRTLDTELAAPDVEAAIEAAVDRLRRRTTAAAFCAQCGAAVRAEDKFCSNCGEPIADAS